MFFSLIVAIVLFGLMTAIAGLLRVLKSYRVKAREGGFASLDDYMRATPRTDAEKQDAVDLALRGLVLCVIGLLLPPFLIVGLFPLFYGARKMAYWAMGLDQFDDLEQPSAKDPA